VAKTCRENAELNYAGHTMTEHYIVTEIDGEGTATLRKKAGHLVRVPSAWLPQGLSEGAAVIVEASAAPTGSEISVRLVGGVSEPEGTDIGA
jgi:hypothetical protein